MRRGNVPGFIADRKPFRVVLRVLGLLLVVVVDVVVVVALAMLLLQTLAGQVAGVTSRAAYRLAGLVSAYLLLIGGVPVVVTSLPLCCLCGGESRPEDE